MHKRRRLAGFGAEAAQKLGDVIQSLPGANRKDPDEDSEFAEAALDDALVALEVLRSQFPVNASRPLPVALMSQIYSLVKDRTEVDRSLDRACKRGEVRMFMAPGSSTERLVLKIEDYRKSLRDSLKRAAVAQECGWGAGLTNRQPGRRDREAQQGASVRAEIVFERFSSRVLPEHTGLCLSKKDLCRLLDLGSRGAGTKEEGESEGMSEEDKQVIDLLTKAGAVASRDAFTLWFTPVGCGTLLHEAVSGREELMTIVGRYKFGEVLVRELSKKRLRGSSLGVRFHLRDMVGRGLVELIETTSGPMVKLVTAGRK